MGESYSAAVVFAVGLVVFTAIAGGFSGAHEISEPATLLTPHSQIVAHHMVAPRIEHMLAQRFLAAP